MKLVSQNKKQDAIAVLENGGILGVPTETVFGLAVKADNQKAIQKLLNLKDRQVGSGKVLTMMVADVDDMQKYAVMTKRITSSARHYFPGELTMLLPKNPNFKHEYFDSFDTIGIRIPEHEYMLSLLKETGPLLVTSANPRGEAPCMTSDELRKRMPKVDGVVRGKSGGNLPSTVINWCNAEPFVVRQGGLLVVKY